MTLATLVVAVGADATGKVSDEPTIQTLGQTAPDSAQDSQGAAGGGEGGTAGDWLRGACPVGAGHCAGGLYVPSDYHEPGTAPSCELQAISEHRDDCDGADLTAALWLTGPVMYVPTRVESGRPAAASSVMVLDARGRLPDVQSGYGVRQPNWRTLSASQQEFFRGYDDAGGPVAYREHLIAVLDCESGWTDNRSAGYLSAAQFNVASWNRAGGGDPSDFYTVGRNVAVWISLISDPGGSGGWPVCWHVGGW